jgi:hypothetical protein
MRYLGRKTLLASFLAFTGFGIMTMNAAPAGDVVGWMEVTPAGGQLRITGRAFAPDGGSVEYTLQIQRSGRSGNTSTKQGGKAEIQAGEIATLSTTSVNLQPQDQLAVLLTVSRGGQVLATSGIHVGGPAR